MSTSFLVFKIRRATADGSGLLVMGRPDGSSSVMLSKGETVELRRPDGTSMKARVIRANVPVPSGFEGLELSGAIREEDVPAGTEVWFHLAD